MKTLTYFVALLFVACSHSPSTPDSVEMGENKSRDTVSFKQSEISTEGVSSTSSDSTELIEELVMIRSKRIEIEEKYKALKELMTNDKSSELASYIKFPLDARSADAFGYGADSMVKEQFIVAFRTFFTDVLMDSLALNSETFEAYAKGETIRWRMKANTFDPPNKEREWGLECGSRMYGVLENDELVITGFGSLCGGVL